MLTSQYIIILSYYCSVPKPLDTMEPNTKDETPKRDEEFNQAVEELKLAVGEWIEQVPTDQKQEWLRHIHGRYSDKFLNDNNKIWIIGSILIPASLAGLLTLKDLTIYTAIPLAAGSILLMWFWNEFADHHRAFQTKSEAVVKAIELYSGLQILKLKVGATKPHNVQKLRKFLTIGVAVIWLCVVFLTGIKSSLP